MEKIGKVCDLLTRRRGEKNEARRYFRLSLFENCIVYVYLYKAQMQSLV